MDAGLAEIGIFLDAQEEGGGPGPVALSGAAKDVDPYPRLKNRQRDLELLKLRETYVKDEHKSLQRELVRAQEDIKRIRSVPLIVGRLVEMVGHDYAIVTATGDEQHYARVLSTINRDLLAPNCTVALHRHSYAVVEVLPPDADTKVKVMLMHEKPDVSFADIGGLDVQKRELREAVELPLTHPELFAQLGIDPPKGVLLYGPPGTGKTMLAKAVAHDTTAAFLKVSGSEFAQKWLGDGPKMVRDLFRMARENSPAIIFIDEVDAIGTSRFDGGAGTDREMKRVLMELLAQMDGFDQSATVRVIMASNRAETLDPALLRPGRLDRRIHFPPPDRRQKRLVFEVVTAKMNLGPDVQLESFVDRPEQLSPAEITAVCQEAGLHAVRANRYVVLHSDFEKAYRNNTKKAGAAFDFYE